MEDIENKAYDDELNKAEESIEKSPCKFIPVPKSNNKQNSQEDGKEEC